MKLKHGMALLTALLLAPFAVIARTLAAPTGVDALNVQGTHDGPLTRSAEVAITEHQLLAFGTLPGSQVRICTAALRPLGFAHDDAAANTPIGVELMTDGNTKLGIASKAIAAGVRVFATAGGKLTDVPVTGCFLVGEALTAAAGDNSQFEVMTLSPVLMP